MWLQRSGSAAFVLLVIFFFMPKSAGGRTRENDDDDASFADMATETTLDGCAAGYQLLKLVGYE
jgi:hypothetical protein